MAQGLQVHNHKVVVMVARPIIALQPFALQPKVVTLAQEFEAGGHNGGHNSSTASAMQHNVTLA